MAKKMIKSWKEKSKYYICSHKDWNGGKNYRTKLTQAKATRMNSQGYVVTLDPNQKDSEGDNEDKMKHHRRW